MNVFLSNLTGPYLRSQVIFLSSIRRKVDPFLVLFITYFVIMVSTLIPKTRACANEIRSKQEDKNVYVYQWVVPLDVGSRCSTDPRDFRPKIDYAVSWILDINGSPTPYRSPSRQGGRYWLLDHISSTQLQKCFTCIFVSTVLSLHISTVLI